MQVDVYFNLHKRMFSVRAREGESKGRVIHHLPECAVQNARFVVSESGRQRVLHEGRKNVHAYVRGELVEDSGGYIKTMAKLANDAGTLRALKYNPYMYNSFVEESTEEPIYEAGVCLMMRVLDSHPVMFAV